MLDLAKGVRAQIIKETAPKVAKKKIFTMQGLRRVALWGGMASGALLIAVIASRSDVGTQRLASAFSGGRTQVATRSFDAEAETRRLAEAVRGLSADGEQIKSRLATVEQDVSDVTGSIGKQIEAATQTPRAADGPTVSATAAIAAAMPLQQLQSPGAPAPVTTQSTTQSLSDAAAAGRQTAYGADIGSGLTIEALRARWTALRAAHPALFEGLQPIVTVKDVVTVKETSRTSRTELRLVVGPFSQAGAATQFCTSLALFGLFCQPTIFDGQRLALRSRLPGAEQHEQHEKNPESTSTIDYWGLIQSSAH